MNPQLYLVVAALGFAIALHGLLVARELLRRIIAANVLSSTVFLFILSASVESGSPRADPVAQALVLTGIVVAVSVTAFALALLRRVVDSTGRAVLPEDEE